MSPEKNHHSRRLLTKKGSRGAISEYILLASLVVMAAIYGLGSVGSSIQKQFQTLLDDFGKSASSSIESLSPEKQKQMYETMRTAVMNAGIENEEDADQIASVAANTATESYLEAINSEYAKSLSPEEAEIYATRIAAWEAYKSVYEQNGTAEQRAMAHASARAAYKAMIETMIGRESTEAELVGNIAYASALETASTVLAALKDSQRNTTLDVKAAAATVAEQFTREANIMYEEINKDRMGSSPWIMTYSSGPFSSLYSLLQSIVADANMDWEKMPPNPELLRKIDRAAAASVLYENSYYAYDVAYDAYGFRSELAKWAEQVRNGTLISDER